jgi:hypothetical protein
MLNIFASNLLFLLSWIAVFLYMKVPDDRFEGCRLTGVEEFIKAQSKVI